MTDPRPRIAEDLGLRVEQADALLRTLLRATRADLEALRQALGAAQADSVASLAHHVKGAAANLEIEALRAPAARLETLGRKGNLTGAGRELDVLESALRGLEEILGAAGSAESSD